MKNAIELIRVSTESQAGEDRASIPAQRAINRKTAAAHGLEIVHSIEIADVSGAAVLYAPQMQELLRMIASPDIHGVVAREFSRLMRPENARDYALLECFAETKTQLFLPDGPIDFCTKTGRLMGTIRAAIAGLERQEILDRVWGAKEEKRRGAQNPQSSMCLPHGVAYDRAANTWSYTAEAESVRAAFAAFMAGEHNYAHLARLMGVTPRGASCILRNPIYAGTRVIEYKRDMSARPRAANRGLQADRPKIRRAPEEIIRVRVFPADAALISEAEFQRVQEIMDVKATHHWRKKYGEAVTYVYTGFLTCALCGQILHTGNGRGQNRYYVCKGRRVLHNCPAGWMNRDRLEEKLDGIFADRLTDIAFVRDIVAEMDRRRNSSGSAARVQRLQEQLARLEQRRQRVVDSYCEGIMSREDRNTRLARIAAETSSTELLLAQQEEAAPPLGVEELAQLLQPFASWKFLARSDKRALLKGIVPDIHVADYAVSGVALHPGVFAGAGAQGEFSGRDNGDRSPVATSTTARASVIAPR